MRRMVFTVLILFSTYSSLDLLLNSLDARPGGGSSYRSSGGSSRSSGSSSRSSGSSYRSSGSSYSGGGGGGTPITKEGVISFFTFVFFILAMAMFLVNFPEKPFASNSWSMSALTWNFFAFSALAVSAKFAYMGNETFLYLILGTLYISPFILFYYSIKNIFGQKERIFIAKGKK